MRSLFNGLLALVLLNGSIYGQATHNEKILQLLHDHNIHPSVFSIHAVNTSSNEESISYRSDELMIPASSMKVITTFTALDLLGKEFNYKTSVGFTGIIGKDGTLNGNVVIKGSGDPSLGTFREDLGSDYINVISKIISAIKRVGIIVDPSRFKEGGTHPGWSWNDVGNYYGAGVYGLNINENEYLIHFNRNVAIDTLVKIERLEPNVQGMSIECQVTLAEEGTGDNAYIYGGEGFYHKIIKGTIPAGKGNFKIRGSLPYPPLFMAQEIASELDKNGITHSGPLVKQNQQSTIELLQFKSKPIEDIIKVANSRSINLYCEAILRSISTSGSRSDALNHLERHIDSIGLDTMSIIQKDGSGLHSRNVITSRLFTQFLTHYFRMWKGNALELLPRASYEGTVRGLLKSKKSKGKAWLKSGYIGGVLSYTGYIKNSKGKIVSISIMANNFQHELPEIREVCEKIIEEVYLN